MASVSSVDQRRFERLYDEHRLAVLAYCTRRVQGSEAADACAETFLVAWRRIHDVPASPATLPYLYGIARRVIANQHRTFRRRSRLEARLLGLGLAPPVDPSVVSLQSVQDREVVAAVRSLPPKDREIVMLWAWEDLPRSTIAEIMGMTTAAVDQRIHRAYRRLARTLRGVVVDDLADDPPAAEREAT